MQELYLADGFNITWAIVHVEHRRIETIFSICNSRLPLIMRYKLHLDDICKNHGLIEVGENAASHIMGIKFTNHGTLVLTDMTYGSIKWDKIEEEVENLKSIASKCAEDEMPDFGKRPRKRPR